MDLVERSGDSERRHPWETARSRFFCDLLERNHLLDSLSWLDVGSGDAWFARQLLNRLRSDATITAWDAFYSPEELGAHRTDRLQLVAGQPDKRYDRVMLMDVVEHVEDDRSFLRGVIETNLADDGRVLITVPAYQKLFSEHDVQLRHFRRYSPAQCRSLIADCGLEICEQGGLFHGLLVARAVGVGVEKLRKKNKPQGIGSWSHGDSTTNAVLTALRFEGKLSATLARRGLTIPGLTFWALCERQSV